MTGSSTQTFLNVILKIIFKPSKHSPPNPYTKCQALKKTELAPVLKAPKRSSRINMKTHPS